MRKNQEITTIQRQNLHSKSFVHYSEKENQVKTNSGDIFLFQETCFNALQFIHCDYSLCNEEHLSINIEKEVLEMHFRMNGSSGIHRSGKPLHLTKGDHILTYQQDNRQDVVMCPEERGSFLEIRIGLTHFERLMTDFASHSPTLFQGKVMTITPAMYYTLSQIENNHYSGKMKALYLESKMTELFLLQLQQSISHSQQRPFSFRQTDKDRLYETKQFIEQHINQFLTIAELAQFSGMNRRKLMQGFKELFGMTVYNFINDMKMEEARRLLLEEEKYVNEVADYIGYKNSQHFIAAFKKKFGISPGKLKK